MLLVHHILNNNGITVNNVIELHKRNSQASFRKLFLSYLINLASASASTPIKGKINSEVADAVYLMSANLRILNSGLEKLSQLQLSTNSTNKLDFWEVFQPGGVWGSI